MAQRSFEIHEVEAPPLQPYHLLFWFRTNGVSDPVDFRGTIMQVQRLTSTGGIEFYRITTGTSNDAPRVLAPKVKLYYASATALGDVDGGEELDARIPDGLTMPTAVAAHEHHIDVVVYDAGVATNQVAAGRMVSLHLVYDLDNVYHR